jgi:DNA-binding PadR family transcriptional regulator
MDQREPPPLAPRDLLVLSVLAAGPLHGYGIVRAVEDRSAVLLDPANLYRALRRMRRDGWVMESREEAADERRRTFTLTSTGEHVLRSEVARLERLLREVRPGLAAAATTRR